MTTPIRAPEPDGAALRVLVVGHADHGKSSVIGRLFSDARLSRFAGAAAPAETSAQALWAADVPMAHEVRVHTGERAYAILDAPDPGPVLKAMLCGALEADAALLVIDASEGVREPSRRHGQLLQLLGLRQVVVIVNKMDLVDYEQEQFELIEEELRHHLAGLGLSPSAFIPVSARRGDGVAGRLDQSERNNMPWYEGPSLVEALDALREPPARGLLPLRLVVTAAKGPGEVTGVVRAGTVRVGDRVLATPGNKLAAVTAVDAAFSFAPWRAPQADAGPAAMEGEAVRLQLDPPLALSAGVVLSHETAPPRETQRFRTLAYWVDDRLTVPGEACIARLNGVDTLAVVEAVEHVVHAEDLSPASGAVLTNDRVGEATLRVARPLAVDDHADVWPTGRVTLFAPTAPSGAAPGPQLAAGFVRL